MGGREAIRGFAIQTLVALLDAVAIDQNWTAVTIEPDSSNDKVDIRWRYPDKVRVVQVKSSKNVIGTAEVKKWADDLKEAGRADCFELKLAGPVVKDLFKTNTFNGVLVPTPSSISLFDLIEQAVTKLDKYLSSKGIDTVPVGIREELVNICAARLLNGSSTGEEVSRESFDGWLLHWITTSYPQALATRLDSNCEILWGSFNILPPVPGSRAFALELPLTVFNIGKGAAIIEWLVVQVASGCRRMIYAPDKMTIHRKDRVFSKFIVGPNQSLDVDIRLAPRMKAGFSLEAWPLGETTLEIFVKYSGVQSPRSVGKTSVTITGDHMNLLNGSGVITCTVSTLEDYLDSL